MTRRPGRELRLDPSELTDQELLATTAEEPEAFGHFYDRYYDRVFVYFVRRVSCPHTAGDLTAETFAKALIGCRRYRKEEGTATAWLFGIARHELLGMARKNQVSDRALQRLGIRGQNSEDLPLERIEAIFDAQRKSQVLQDAIKQLPTTLAEAVTLRIAHNLSFEEVAEMLGCSMGAARVRVSRGLARLVETVHA